MEKVICKVCHHIAHIIRDLKGKDYVLCHHCQTALEVEDERPAKEVSHD